MKRCKEGNYEKAGVFFFFKHEAAYGVESRVWSSDVCSSDLIDNGVRESFYQSSSGTYEMITARSRSEERRVGKEWDSTCRLWWSPEHQKKITMFALYHPFLLI